MKKQLVLFAVLLLMICQSCKKKLQDITLEKYGITITIPETQGRSPEFLNLKSDENDKTLSSYDFNIDKARVNVFEIVESIYPSDTTMLKKVAAGSENFLSLIETKKLSNGAFGIIFNMKGSSGKDIKNYLFYFKKGERYFRIEPLFNNKLDQLDLQLAAIESMK